MENVYHERLGAASHLASRDRMRYKAVSMIYADYNGTTPLCPSAIEGIETALQNWGNPSSSHAVGRKALELLEKCRASVAKVCQVKPLEVVFTSGGSESNTLALMGSWFEVGDGFRVLSTGVEHSSVKGNLCFLEKKGVQVELLQVLRSGELNLDTFQLRLEQFRPHLVSIMTANNETGVLFPIPEIAKRCKDRGVTFHTDAVQALGKVDPRYFNVADLISVSSHKIYGPKGAGALIVKSDKKLVPTNFGGSQELKRRGGTQGTVSIAGFAGACDALCLDKIEELRQKRDLFETLVKTSLDGVSLQGSEANRTANTSNIRFHGISSDTLLTALDLDGICVSGGSACSSGSAKPSDVLLKMGLTAEEAGECVRISWGCPTTEAEIRSAAETVTRTVQRIRARRK